MAPLQYSYWRSGLRSAFFINELTDDLSKAMVKKVQNRYGFEM
jgi:hypothetical protein